MDPSMRKVLEADEKVRGYVSTLEKEGITKWSDVKELDANELKELGLNLMARKRLLSLSGHHESYRTTPVSSSARNDETSASVEGTPAASMWRRVMLEEGADLYFLSEKKKEDDVLREGAEILHILKLRHRGDEDIALRGYREVDGYRIENSRDVMDFMTRACPLHVGSDHDIENRKKKGTQPTAILRAVAIFPYRGKREYELVFEETDRGYRFRGSRYVIFHAHPVFYDRHGKEFSHEDLKNDGVRELVETIKLGQMNVRYGIPLQKAIELVARADQWYDKIQHGNVTPDEMKVLRHIDRLKNNFCHMTAAGKLNLFNEPSYAQRQAINAIVGVNVWKPGEVNYARSAFKSKNEDDMLVIKRKMPEACEEETDTYRRMVQQFFTAIETMLIPRLISTNASMYSLRAPTGSLEPMLPIIDAKFTADRALTADSAPSISDVAFLSIAVSTYASAKIKDLANPMRDSFAWQAAMRRHGAHTTHPMGAMYEHPTKEAILRNIVDALHIFASDDTLRMLVVHLAGHAVQIEGCPYFLPSDATKHDAKSYLNLNNLFSEVKKPVLCIFDFCRLNEIVGTRKNVTSKNIPGWVFYTAPPGEGVPDGPPGTMSPATRALLSGIFGEEGRRKQLNCVLSNIASKLKPSPQFSQLYHNGTRPDDYYIFKVPHQSTQEMTQMTPRRRAHTTSCAFLSELEQRVQRLETIKTNALLDEQYDLARETINELETIRSQIRKIKSLKRDLQRGIEKDDIDACKKIKEQIKTLVFAALSPSTQQRKRAAKENVNEINKPRNTIHKYLFPSKKGCLTHPVPLKRARVKSEKSLRI